jgi:hypothetical protein
MDTAEIESFDMDKAPCGRRHGSIEVRRLKRVRVEISPLTGALTLKTFEH